MNSQNIEGRDSSGRFVTGNKLSNGNPHGGKVARLRARLLECGTAEAVAELAGQLLEIARSGSKDSDRIAASKVLLEYWCGKADRAPTEEQSQAFVFRLEEPYRERATGPA